MGSGQIGLPGDRERSRSSATADPILFHALQASFSVNGRATVQRNDELLLPMT